MTYYCTSSTTTTTTIVFVVAVVTTAITFIAAAKVTFFVITITPPKCIATVTRLQELFLTLLPLTRPDDHDYNECLLCYCSFFGRNAPTLGSDTARRSRMYGIVTSDGALPNQCSSLRHVRSSNKRSYASTTQLSVGSRIGEPICKDPCSTVAPLPRIPMVQRCCGNVRARPVLW